MKIESLRWTGMALISAALLAGSGCASTSNNQRRARAGVVTETRTRTATVESIDASARTIALRNPDGTVTGYYCRPQVQNFDQIKIGDKVTSTITVETTMVLGKGGVLPAAPVETAVVRAPPGEKPGGKMVDSMNYVGNIVSVNPQNRELTFLSGVAGVLRTVKVSRDIDLAHVKPGDDVRVQVTNELTIGVETP